MFSWSSDFYRSEQNKLGPKNSIRDSSFIINAYLITQYMNIGFIYQVTLTFCIVDESKYRGGKRKKKQQKQTYKQKNTFHFSERTLRGP